mmetsp:Transcript_49445/g.116877  ORF Transcript_49445/g.116877 Transcript_49445/m.116877 type:complete len:365 (-) Transcript_49445:339-1433(-)
MRALQDGNPDPRENVERRLVHPLLYGDVARGAQKSLHARQRHIVACGIVGGGGSEGDVHVVERQPVVVYVLEPQVHHGRPPGADGDAFEGHPCEQLRSVDQRERSSLADEGRDLLIVVVKRGGVPPLVQPRDPHVEVHVAAQVRVFPIVFRRFRESHHLATQVALLQNVRHRMQRPHVFRVDSDRTARHFLAEVRLLVLREGERVHPQHIPIHGRSIFVQERQAPCNHIPHPLLGPDEETEVLVDLEEHRALGGQLERLFHPHDALVQPAFSHDKDRARKRLLPRVVRPPHQARARRLHQALHFGIVRRRRAPDILEPQHDARRHHPPSVCRRGRFRCLHGISRDSDDLLCRHVEQLRGHVGCG